MIRLPLYIAILVATAFSASFAYSIAVLLGAEPLPALGFSGVVMGMIGLAAFLMPRAKIKTFFWMGAARPYEISWLEVACGFRTRYVALISSD